MRPSASVSLFIPHAGQRALCRGLRRFNVARMGRRWGKTIFGIDYLLDDLGGIRGALGKDGARNGSPVAWFAPNYKLLGEPWREMKRILRSVIVSKNEVEHRLDLKTGGSIEFWTLDTDDPARGRKYAKVVIDEAAMSRGLLDKWNAAIRPTLSDLEGGALFCSTPKGRNDFWKIHQSAQALDDWATFHAPTRSNPYISMREIEAARRSLPERIFLQEYEAEFIDSGGGVFRRVTSAVDQSLSEGLLDSCDPGDGRAFIIGVDWARLNDFTVFIVIDAARKAVVAFDRFRDIEYAIQLARLRALHKRFPKAPILAESNSMGGPLVEALRRERLPVRSFQTTAASKAEIIEALSLAFEREEIRIPPVPELVDELLAFDQERLPSGAVRYGAPNGSFDDCVMALAIAWHGVIGGASAVTVAVSGERIFR